MARDYQRPQACLSYRNSKRWIKECCKYDQQYINNNKPTEPRQGNSRPREMSCIDPNDILYVERIFSWSYEAVTEFPHLLLIYDYYTLKLYKFCLWSNINTSFITEYFLVVSVMKISGEWWEWKNFCSGYSYIQWIHYSTCLIQNIFLHV